MQRDLDLKRHGLSLMAPDVRVFAPSPDGTAVTLWDDVARTADGLRSRSAADADAYPGFDRLVRSIGRFLDELGRSAPPDVKAPGLGDALTGLKLGRTFRGLGREDSRTILRVLPMAVADLVAEAFETDALRAAIAWRGVRYCAVGPWSAGTAAVLLMDSAGNDGGAAGETVFARGGPGALSAALASAARAAGAEIRTEAEVVAITSTDGRATGVVLASGEEIAARAVVSGLDPKRTLVDLVDPVALGPSLGWRAGNIRTPGVVAKVNFALRKLPVFPAAGEDVGPAAPRPDRRRARHRRHGAGLRRVEVRRRVRVADPRGDDPVAHRPAASSKARGPGTHVMSVIAQYAPYRLRDGGWSRSAADAFGDAVIATLEGVAPGIGKLVTHRHVITPVDLERDYGLTGGHPLHAEPGLDQFYLWRPLLGHARYRIGGIDGLYLCGSGGHPGGGVTGGPGQNAAREILADAKKRR